MIQLMQPKVSIQDMFDVKWNDVQAVCKSHHNNSSPVNTYDMNSYGFQGWSKKITHILDKGYTISVKDVGMRIKMLFIEKNPSTNGTLVRTQGICLNAFTVREAFEMSFIFFTKTLSKNQPYKYEEFFNEKNSIPLQNPVNSNASTLDQILSENNIRLTLRKSSNQKNYELAFASQHVMHDNKDEAIITFDTLSE